MVSKDENTAHREKEMKKFKLRNNNLHSTKPVELQEHDRLFFVLFCLFKTISFLQENLGLLTWVKLQQLQEQRYIYIYTILGCKTWFIVDL